jgi:anti-sigma-K factor RskA
MSTTLHPDADDLLLYSMQSLDSNTTAQIHAHLQQCAECAAAIVNFNTDLALLALSAPSATPPASARQRLLDAARGVSTATAASTAPSPAHAKNVVDISSSRTSSNGVFTWLGWAVAAASLFFVVHLRQANQSLHSLLQSETAELIQLDLSSARAEQVLNTLTSPHAKRVSLVAGTTPPKPSGHAIYVKERGALLFTADNFAPLPPNKVYELWVIPANGSAPIPAGTFAPDASGFARVILPKIPVGVDAKAFGVTMENAGGALTPTMPILIAGA